MTPREIEQKRYRPPYERRTRWTRRMSAMRLFWLRCQRRWYEYGQEEKRAYWDRRKGRA